jgi:error-prone DNA polymerase
MTEYELLGLSTGEHVMALYRSWLKQQGILGSWELKTQPAGKRVQVAGLVVVHQAPPTAKNFHFVTIEDERGLLDVIIRPQFVPQIKKLPSWQALGFNDRTLLLVEGIVERDGNVVGVLATRIRPLTIDAIPDVVINPIRASSR